MAEDRGAKVRLDADQIIDSLEARITPAMLRAGIYDHLAGMIEEPGAEAAVPVLVEKFRSLEPWSDRLAREPTAHLAELVPWNEIQATLDSLTEAGLVDPKARKRLEYAAPGAILGFTLVAIREARSRGPAPTPRNHPRNPWWCFAWDPVLARYQAEMSSRERGHNG